jgi:hypothetical protein
VRRREVGRALWDGLGRCAAAAGEGDQEQQ